MTIDGFSSPANVTAAAAAAAAADFYRAVGHRHIWISEQHARDDHGRLELACSSSSSSSRNEFINAVDHMPHLFYVTNRSSNLVVRHCGADHLPGPWAAAAAVADDPTI
jgi:hypothetical protein